ncbi:MAG: hypothetical protein WCN87_04105, partial [Chlamydiota bacterium]
MSSSTSSASNKGLYPSLFLYAGVANREFHSPQQVDYIARSESAIQEAITEMRVGDPRGLFGRVLHMLGEHRHQTAVAHATADAGSFGWRRDRSHG